MRHRVGSWKPASTADGPTAVTRSPRPGHRVFKGVVAWVVAAHLVLIAMQWAGGARPQATSSARMSMRLVATPARTTAAVPERAAIEKPVASPAKVARIARTKRPAATPAAPIEAARATPRIEAAPEAPVQARMEQAADAQVITGVAFGLPRIGMPGSADARRMAASPEPTPLPQGPPPAMLMQMQAARAAALSQIADALSREVASWQAPADEGQGACALSAQPGARLACDDERLLAVVAPREAALSGLLSAYRSMDPRMQMLSIAIVQGRYRAAWNAQ